MPCDICNSEVIIVKRGCKEYAECSYCGNKSDEPFISFDQLIDLETEDE